MNSVEAPKTVRAVEHTTSKERLRDLGFFSFKKRKLKQDLIASFDYLIFMENEARLISEVHSDRTRDNKL